jgi:adenylylsulfate kinase-like enzyme
LPLICPKCGAYALNNTERKPNITKCSACGQSTPANIYPLFIVTGASGSGKSTVVAELRCQLPECVVFDSDLLWSRTNEYHNTWLRIAYSVAQGGRYTVICGTLMPWDLYACEERSLVGTIHFLNLHCSNEVREKRLRSRPAWRQSSNDAYIEEHRRFAQWLLDNAASAYNPHCR